MALLFYGYSFENIFQFLVVSGFNLNTTCHVILVLLQEYKPARNLAFNEEVKRLMVEGKKIYHLGFGQVRMKLMPLTFNGK